MRGTLEERWMAKFAPEPNSGCWLWTAATNGHGYGLISPRRSRVHHLAHRVAWELTHGPIPVGMFVLHRCDMPPCVNPDHLFLGTQADNVRDCFAKKHHPSVIPRITCKRGHPLTDDNVYRWTNSSGKHKRMCRTCALARAAQKYSGTKGS